MKKISSRLGLVAFILCIPACLSSKKSLLETENPLISHFEWGKVIVDFGGSQYAFKDCKLSPKGPQEWDWKEFETKHVPGIQIEDLQSIIKDSDIIILSRGVDLMLQTPVETIDYLKQLGKEVYVLQSEEAVKRYNELAKQQKKVGILLHSTC